MVCFVLCSFKSGIIDISMFRYYVLITNSCLMMLLLWLLSQIKALPPDYATIWLSNLTHTKQIESSGSRGGAWFERGLGYKGVVLTDSIACQLPAKMSFCLPIRRLHMLY